MVVLVATRCATAQANNVAAAIISTPSTLGEAPVGDRVIDTANRVDVAVDRPLPGDVHLLDLHRPGVGDQFGWR